MKVVFITATCLGPLLSSGYCNTCSSQPVVGQKTGSFVKNQDLFDLLDADQTANLPDLRKAWGLLGIGL